ncbi:hypothetical protein Q7P37_010583 [Cladosporium fusiforme]
MGQGGALLEPFVLFGRPQTRIPPITLERKDASSRKRPTPQFQRETPKETNQSAPIDQEILPPKEKKPSCPPQSNYTSTLAPSTAAKCSPASNTSRRPTRCAKSTTSPASTNPPPTSPSTPAAQYPAPSSTPSLVITESNAIIIYAAELASDAASDLPAYPRDRKLRADINRWLFWEASAWFPACYTYLVQNVVQPLLGQEPDASVLKSAEPRWRELAGVLEQRLVKQGDEAWLCGRGREPSVADLAVAASMHLWRKQGFPIEGFPALRRWMGRVEGLECWRETQGDVEKALSG